VKATLEFDLSDPQGKDDLNCALGGKDLRAVILKVLENLRNKRKHAQLPRNQIKLIETLETDVRELIMDHKLTDLFY